jgi:O-antigen/teichoic acid export membrane protein
MTTTQASTEGTPGVMRGVAKHTLVYALGIIARPAASFLLLPIYTLYLSPADYGVLALIELSIDFLQMFTGVQILSGVARFYHASDTTRSKHTIVATAAIALVAGYFVISVLAFFGAEQLSARIFVDSDRSGWIRIASASMAMQPLALATLVYARIADRSKIVLAAGLSRLGLQISLNLLFLVVLGKGPESVLWAALITDTVTGVVLAAWFVRRVGLHFSWDALKKLASFGYPMIGVSIAGYIFTFADRFFLYGAADEGTVGLYQLAYKFGFLLLAVGFTPFMSVWGPQTVLIRAR